MKRVRAPVAALAEGERALDAAAARYLGRVLRLGPGDAFVAFDPARALEADAEIVRVGGAELIVRIGAPRPPRVIAARHVTWIQGLAKGDKCDAVVRDATELGATRIVIAATARSVVRLDAARAKAKGARWESIAREAARQSGRADPPRVEGPRAWEDALALGASDALDAPGARRASTARVVLHPAPDAPPLGPLLEAALDAGGPLAFAAGPEGGFTGEELAAAGRAGWTIASLGPVVLRTETACAAVLGAVRVLAG
jgi:16S rRNA (uracil1498-N3)-methyltransferase